MSFNGKQNLFTRVYRVTLWREFYQSIENALERAKGMDGLGDPVGVCTHRFYGDVSQEICETLSGRRLVG